MYSLPASSYVDPLAPRNDQQALVKVGLQVSIGVDTILDVAASGRIFNFGHTGRLSLLLDLCSFAFTNISEVKSNKSGQGDMPFSSTKARLLPIGFMGIGGSSLAP